MDEKQRYERARNRIKKIRGFYEHLAVFLIVLPILFFVRYYGTSKWNIAIEDPHARDWIYWNTVILVGVWLLVLIVHGILVFRWGALRRWEARKIAELMEKEQKEKKQLWK